MISLVLTGVICFTLLNFSAAAVTTAPAAPDANEGEIVTMNIIAVNSDGMEVYTDSSTSGGEEVVAYMQAQGWTPGSTFYVGNKKYEVLDDYQIAHQEIVLDLAEEVYYTEENNVVECVNDNEDTFYLSRQDLLVMIKCL